ncbi:MAG: hypothetical protein IT350_15865, partial [Deltaproteobacteria bacterium]|nr:hypothetical protein [Deltaproteobacteria bacterium]
MVTKEFASSARRHAERAKQPPRATGSHIRPGKNSQRLLLLPDGMPPTKTTCVFDATDGSGSSSASWDPYASEGMGRMINLPGTDYLLSCSSESARAANDPGVNFAWKYSGVVTKAGDSGLFGKLLEGWKSDAGKQRDTALPVFFIIFAEPDGDAKTGDKKKEKDKDGQMAVANVDERNNASGRHAECKTQDDFMPGKKCHAFAGQPVSLPTIDATIKGLSSATAGPKMRPSQRALSPQGFGEQAADDFFQAVAEVMVERAKSKGTRLLQNEIREVFCEELFIDLTGDKPKIGPKTDDGRAFPIFPTTCEAVRSASVNDLAGFGRQLQSTIVDDLMLTGARLMMLRLRDNESFASIPTEFDQVVVELLQSLTAQARNGGLDADKLSQTVFVKLSAMLQDPDLYTPVLKSMAARSRTIQSLQRSLTENTNGVQWGTLSKECGEIKDSINKVKPEELTKKITSQFYAIQGAVSDYKKAKLGNPNPQGGENLENTLARLVEAVKSDGILDEIQKLDA